MTYKRPQAIIFDMDGLLVASEPVWHQAEAEMIESRGHEYPLEVRAQVIGLRMDEFLGNLHAIYHFNESVEELHRELVDRMLELIPVKVEPRPGAVELVDYVRRIGLPTAIASSSPMSIIEATVQAQGWGEVFSVRCSADDDARGKPAPDVYLRAARILGVAPADCLALEDSSNGARAAVAAGMTCYAVPDSVHIAPATLAAITPYIFTSLHDVRRLLETDG
ncbi:MAG: HAD family phosphatase [Anaerolineae bacterium]|nr:HAD family phosphatase [Anaerolineae bacterium]